MIQGINERNQAHLHLGGKSTPVYFRDEFVIPWCDKKTDEGKYSVSKDVQNSLKEASRFIDIKKNNEVNDSKKESIKCSAKSCSYTGINPQNKTAVGTCTKCGKYEHFSRGILDTFFSTCFSSNPAISLEQSTEKDMEDEDTNIQTRVVKPLAIEFTKSPARTPTKHALVKQCDSCHFETHCESQLIKHKEQTHKETCTECGEHFQSERGMSVHQATTHRMIDRTDPDLACDECPETFNTRETLNEHIREKHASDFLSCNDCSSTFASKDELLHICPYTTTIHL